MTTSFTLPTWKTRASFAAVILVVAVMFTAGCRTKSAEETPAAPAVDNADSSSAADQPTTTPAPEVTRIVVETQVIEITPTRPPTPDLPKHLDICISGEPESLYLYSSPRPSTSKEHLLSAVYEPLYTTLNYAYQPRGLIKVPSLRDGDARLVSTVVNEGDKVLDINGNIAILKSGIEVLTSVGERSIYTGEPLMMDQLEVDFEIQPYVWSDGVPVTADDSVFSFELAADPHTPVPKVKIDRTASYRATGDLTLEWIGIPGFMDRQYSTNVWTPLPRHAWGEMGAANLLLNEEANFRPMGYGPYVISDWEPGEKISFDRNESYYRTDEGYPKIDTLSMRFVADDSQGLQLLLSGECDLLTHDLLNLDDAPALREADDKGLIKAYIQPGTIFEHIDFGINPVEEYETERPDWFEIQLVRQAFVKCIDRQAIIDELLYGEQVQINAYVPDSHPLFPEDPALWPYDVEGANALLDQAGFMDFDEDGIRNDPRLAGEFQVDLLVSLGNDSGLRIASAVQEDLALCGVEIAVESIDSDLYFSDGPESPLFGRRFDLAEFPWLISIEPNCSLYLSSRTPGPENSFNRNYNNNTGFSNSSYDHACSGALAALPGTDEYENSHREALRIWMEEMPVIPLFLRLKLAASRPEVIGFTLDSTQNSSLWNLSELDTDAAN